MPRRYPTLVQFALLGVMVAIVVVVALLFLGPPVSQVFYHPPIATDANCEPTVADVGPTPPPGACIQTVIPERGPDSAYVVVDLGSDVSHCYEGCPTWLQVRSEEDGVVLQQGLAAALPACPSPPGTYAVSVIPRPCPGTARVGDPDVCGPTRPLGHATDA
jgi:hypothetical protein